ncbi:hypothetical protein ARMSODRAFT_978800 [Armillaria solidipes]|uniref:Uncharacterized protein n=1 Tax=Armillaria solidipes TaxID=1076256 RepID=A0A2H3B1S6_9AGAR|nr:hypothetical protein ARMSODRAFT_978800 [Armillaria solidipes]
MIHSPPLAHAHVDSFAHAFKPQQRSGNGGGSEFYAEAMDRHPGGTAPHTFHGRHRSPPPARPFTGDFEPSFKCAANDVSISKERMDGRGREFGNATACAHLEKAFIDFFSLAIQLQQSTTLRHYSPPFNPLRLIKQTPFEEDSGLDNGVVWLTRCGVSGS